MKASSDVVPALLAVGLSGCVWGAFHIFYGTPDPQGEIGYWKFGYPSMLGIAAILGTLFRTAPWRWGVYIIATQFVLGGLYSTGDLNLLPIGILIHIFMTVPAIVLGYIGAFVGSRIWRA